MFSREYSYAVKNGYKDSYQEYVMLQFKKHKEILKRCGIKNKFTFSDFIEQIRKNQNEAKKEGVA